jgi:hypothetical protein
VEDAHGNVETGYSGSVTVGLATDPGAGVLGGTLTVLARNGVATFTDLALTAAGAGYRLLITASGGLAALTTTFNVTPTASARLVVIAEPPARVGLNQPFGLTVALEDSFGNVETAVDGSVTAFLADSSGASSLGGNITVTLENGVATFSRLKLGRTGRNDVLKAGRHDGLPPAMTTPFSVFATFQKSARKETLLVHLRPDVKLPAHPARSKGHHHG